MRTLLTTLSILVLALPCLAQTAGPRTGPPFRPGAPAGEKLFCPEGRTKAGACVNPRLAQAARLTSCIHTQGLLSPSAGLPCTTVFQDDSLRYPNAVYADTKRALDVAFNRRSSSLNSYSYGTQDRIGPGSPNPTMYPISIPRY